MIMSLFRRKKENNNEKIVAALYAAIIDAGRHPTLYADWLVPDTPIGRYEAIGLHIILFLHRTRATDSVLEELSQDLLDEFFLELDHSVRELGVGDAGVPKRMKKLSKMFYGRMGPYWKALDEKDVAALEDALRRNIAPEDPSALNAQPLARYMLECVEDLKQQSNDGLLAGNIHFPDPTAIGS